jgi:biopolymer transport protein TolR
MGMSSGGGNKSNSIQSEINVTPLIDVLLVLLIIFLVVMPIMMKMESLDIPRKIQENEAPDPNAVMLTVKVKVTLDVVLSENDKDTPVAAGDLPRMLRPKIDEMVKRGNERVVFVDFDDGVPWGNVVATMDSIRSLATDVNHDDVKVALKIKEEPKAQ